MSGWFDDLGWWEQEKAYEAFSIYRAEKTEESLHSAIEQALPVIRVVLSTQKINISRAGDADDLIASAAFTITKAIPKMAKKPLEKMGDDKQYMRYLFTCVVNAFFREMDVLHGKSNKIKKRLDARSDRINKTENKLKKIEAELIVSRLPQFLLKESISFVRFESENKKKVCSYILSQLLHGREISKAVLQLLKCSDKRFYIKYCKFLILMAIKGARLRGLHLDDFDCFDTAAEENMYDSEELSFSELDDEENSFTSLFYEEELFNADTGLSALE